MHRNGREKDLRDKAKRLKKFCRKASEEDLEWEPGKFFVKGVR